MQEIELKFQIPVGALGAVRAHVLDVARSQQSGPLGEQILQAAYFDTHDRKLARARAALRVRREDDDWVQTLKAAGPHALSRLEDNQPLPAPTPGTPIAPDLARHTGEARAALVRDLGWQPDTDPAGAHTGLVQLYRTDMRRLRAQQAVHTADGRFLGLVELALDLGEIAAGALRNPVQELEIELVEGHPLAVIEA
ncbi:CYTH domain-containing protein, partial [Aquabacterium sp.]|uniref:CYTH domain-containing protein n=1 Tax=Aquabacterium sp. TaxID=1872578 RepID=UPI0025B9F817